MLGGHRLALQIVEMREAVIPSLFQFQHLARISIFSRLWNEKLQNSTMVRFFAKFEALQTCFV